MAERKVNLFIWLIFVLTIAADAEKKSSDHQSRPPTTNLKDELDFQTHSKSKRSPVFQHKSTPTTSIQEAILHFYRQESFKPLRRSSCRIGSKSCSNEKNPCLPLVSCAAFYDEVIQKKSFCKLGSHALGARCRAPREGSRIQHLQLSTSAAFAPAFANIPAANSQSAITSAFAVLQNQDNLELTLRNNGLVVNNPQTPEFGHLQFFKSAPEAVEISKLALAQNIAATSLMSSSSDSGFSNAPLTDVNPIACPFPPVCGRNDLYFRRHDGSCNNLKNSNWGKAFTPFERMSGTHYSDGVSVPRLSVTGKPLPTARRVSAHIAHDADKPSSIYTLSVMQWGQFIDHDLTQSPISRFDNMTGILCCDQTGLPLPPSLTHPECLHIDIPEDDAFYSKFRQRCMNFVRSLPAPSSNCVIGPRNQMNQLSHFLDGSEIYGSTTAQANALRLFKNGLLKLPKNFLPEDTSTNEFDFLAGDSRVNEQPQLTVLHTIWVRQHNRIAQELLKLNHIWDDERIYQEVRKIVVAQTQHIIYNEWLPIVLGTETMERFSLLPRRRGCIKSYDKNLNPSILNEFAAAAFRFGHTLIQGTLALFGRKYENPESIELSNNFNRPQVLTEAQRFDRLLRGLYKQPMQQFDNCVVDDVTNKLFKTDFTDFGMDLVALNTQRGRDHGIGTYNDILSACHLPRVDDFRQLVVNMRPEVVPLFATLYENVNDIDAFIAGISEKSVHGGVLGTTFNCIIREQFSRLKFGDRFFYENGGMKNSFSECQLNEIRKTSWARIICDNSRNIDKIQPLAFRIPDAYNTKVSCSSETIPKLDLSPWFKYD